MEITVETHDSVPVLTLAGRFDGDGATTFDTCIDSLDRAAGSWILDFSGVRYLSSMGLRSLIRADRRLRERHGALLLVALSAFVRQVLETARLHQHFRTAASVADALVLARAASVAPDRAIERVRHGRTYAVWPLGGRSVLETWGVPLGDVPAQIDPEALATFTLEDLGFAIGVGGFGATRGQACEAIGTLVTARRFAGLRPRDVPCAADFVLPESPGDELVHVASAVGIAGSPALALRVSSDEAFDVADLIGDISALARQDGEGPLPAVAVLAVIEPAADGKLGILMALVADRPAAGRAASGFESLARWLGEDAMADGQLVAGRAVLLAGSSPVHAMTADPADLMASIASLDTVENVASIDPACPVKSARAWVYRPSGLREGRERLLVVDVDGGPPLLPEWESIARRLYRDCRRIVLTPLYGGYMSSTFRVASYDLEGRRLLPTVLKIGAAALTAREEGASRKYVQTFVLNNSTTLLGGASAGDWAGLRYNFLGVTGPDSSLVWLRDHYQRRPVEQVLPLIDAVFTRILKPWYGQPRWEQVALYADHDPRRLFPTLCEVAEQMLGVSADVERLPCPELETDLLNPFHFLRHEYARRRQQSQLWYTSICHGDLNMQNVLVDERENLYVIDFSETRPRNIVSDLARLEPIVKFEMVPLESDAELRRMLQFEQGLITSALDERPRMTYPETNPEVEKAYQVICLLRRHADTVTIFETDIVPYWLALLEWTLPVVAYRQVTPWQKKYAAYSAALLCQAILDRDSGPARGAKGQGLRAEGQGPRAKG
jgi:anti-anti-sigma factor